MVNNLIVNENLERLLQANWSQILDRSQIMRITMEFARDSEYKVVHQTEIPPKQIRISITKFRVNENEFETWIEFTLPKNEGVIVGTHVCSLSLSGELELKESYGTHFVPKSS